MALGKMIVIVGEKEIFSFLSHRGKQGCKDLKKKKKTIEPLTSLGFFVKIKIGLSIVLIKDVM